MIYLLALNQQFTNTRNGINYNSGRVVSLLTVGLAHLFNYTDHHINGTTSTELNMVTSIGNSGIKNLKPGAVLTVSGARTEVEAQTKIERFLNTSNRRDLGYMSISKDCYLLYLK